jgi:hypothetical protein
VRDTKRDRGERARARASSRAKGRERQGERYIERGKVREREQASKRASERKRDRFAKLRLASQRNISTPSVCSAAGSTATSLPLVCLRACTYLYLRLVHEKTQVASGYLFSTTNIIVEAIYVRVSTHTRTCKYLSQVYGPVRRNVAAPDYG